MSGQDDPTLQVKIFVQWLLGDVVALVARVNF